MADQGFIGPTIENVAGKNRRINILFTVQGNTNTALIAGTSNCGAAVQIYTALASLTAPSDANFINLTNGSNSRFGMYLIDGRAIKFGGAFAATTAVQSASMTSVTAFAGGMPSSVGGTVNQGITASGNIALTLNCTGANFAAANLIHQFSVDIHYDVL